MILDVPGVRVGWATALGPNMAQVDYRLRESAGCGLEGPDPDVADAQLAYHLDGEDRALEWVGDGLRDVGIEPGTLLDEAGKKAARRLADGRDPRTGERLVTPKMAADPRGKLPAAALLDAVDQAAAADGATVEQLLAGDTWAAARYGRARRGVQRQGEAHRVPVKELERLAAAAGTGPLDALYDADLLATAREYADARVRVGNRGYDVTLDLPKSYSVLVGLADGGLARELEDTYLTAVREGVGALQGWAAYGQRGHHGDGQTAERVDTSGLLGWLMVHRTARPVVGQAPDPHLHVHVTLMNMVRGVDDGKWSAVAGGGRDLLRHAHAVDALVEARLRALTYERFGIRWERDPQTSAWEIAGVPAELRAAFAKRGSQVAATLQQLGLDTSASRAQQKTAGAVSREAKRAPGAGGDLRADWRAQTAAVGYEADQVVADALGGPGLAAASGPSGPGPRPLTPEQIAEQVFDPAAGLTAHRKVVTRADVLASVAEALPGGVVGAGALEQLVDQVLAVDGYAVRLPDGGQGWQSNATRWTTADIIAAERTVLDAAEARLAAGTAVVDEQLLAAAIDVHETGAGYRLSDEQRTVLARLCTAGNGVDAVVGVAGSGKTTIMSVLRAAHEQAGHTVAGASTAAVAAAKLAAESGIASSTVASWLARIERGRGLAGVDVLVVDESAMVDDRAMARLVDAAGESGTQIVGIGDPLQLKAVGVGGTFAAVHQLVAGETLAENRRQRDPVERAALEAWRAADRRGALQQYADAGQVHAVDDQAAAHTALLQLWDQVRRDWADPYERIEQLLLLAGTNADVEHLNAAAQAVRLADGELAGPGRAYRLAGGGQLRLHVGDQVRVRTNDYRAAASRGERADVLNGYRGVVTGIDRAGTIAVTWRQPTVHGPRLVTEQVSAGYVAAGGLSLGYAITVASAQGLSAERTVVSGAGLDAHTLYPALSRDRGRVDLVLPRALLESDADRARLGAPLTDAEALQRAVAAYAAALERDQPDRLVTSELVDQPVERPAVALARMVPKWWQRPHGALSDTELAAAARTAQTRAERAVKQYEAAQTTAAARRTAIEQALADADAGRGPHATAHTARQDRLDEVLQYTAAADRYTDQAHAIQTSLNAAFDQERALYQDSTRNRFGLWWSGTSRDQIQTDLTELRLAMNQQVAARDAAYRQANIAAQAASTAARAAGLPAHVWGVDTRTLAAAARAAAATGDQDYGAAVDADRAAAAQQPPPRDPAPAGRTARAATDRAAQLRAETQTRVDMSPLQRLAETADRRATRLTQRLHLDEGSAPSPEHPRDVAARRIEQQLADRRASREARIAAERDLQRAQRYDYHLDHSPAVDRDGPSLGL